MKHLVKAEWFKLSKSFGFQVLCLYNAASSMLSAVVLLIAGAKATGFAAMRMSHTYVLHHSVIGCLFVAVFLCGEFANRTYGLSLLSGYSRKKIFLSKVLIFLVGFIWLFLIYTGGIAFIMSIGNGFGGLDHGNILFMLFCGILGYMAMGMIILLIAVMVKRAFVTVGVGMGLMYALGQMENLTREDPFPFLKYTYLYQIRQLHFWGEGFSFWMFLAVEVFTFALALQAAVFIFEHSEKLM